jgi:hypothetical protein
VVTHPIIRELDGEIRWVLFAACMEIRKGEGRTAGPSATLGMTKGRVVSHPIIRESDGEIRWVLLIWNLPIQLAKA